MTAAEALSDALYALAEIRHTNAVAVAALKNPRKSLPADLRDLSPSTNAHAYACGVAQSCARHIDLDLAKADAALKTLEALLAGTADALEAE